MVADSSILRELARSEDAKAREAAHWLLAADAKCLPFPPSDTTVHEALHVWRVRYQSSVKRHASLRGAEAFLERLRDLTPQKKLEQFTFASESVNANLFFEKSSGAFVGVVLAQKPVLEEEEKISGILAAAP